MVNGQGKMMEERRGEKGGIQERKGKKGWTGRLERPRTEGHEKY